MIAKALAANGASKVYIIGRRLSVIEEAAAQSPHGNIIPVQGDITSQDSLKAIATQIEKEVGYINLLVPNAGISGPRVRSPDMPENPSVEQFQKHAWSSPMSDFTKTFNVNVTGVYYTALAFLHLLDAGNKKGNVKGGTSQIVTVSSIAGYSRLRNAGFAYNSSKAAVTHLMKHLSTYCNRWDIRCNVIAPGCERCLLPKSDKQLKWNLTFAVYPSELSAPTIGAFGGGPEGGEMDPNIIPAGRTGNETDMAGIILFLASKAGAYCNGCVIVTDGGRLGVLPSTY
jgi:NAD(P)-dependent dehydrogenase (short-subunit alcohol dehydrogenase family)